MTDLVPAGFPQTAPIVGVFLDNVLRLVFGERLRAITGNTTSSDDDFPKDDFFPDIDNLFGNLKMGDNNQDAANAGRQMNSSGIAAATRPPLFDGSHYKRWRTRAVLWFQNLNCDSALLGKPEGDLSPAQEEGYKKVDAMFKAALFSILADNIVDPYMTFEHGKDAWDALEAKFGVSDAGTELYVMEQYYDYKMTEKARAKDTRARDFEGGSSANVVQKKNFQSHKFKNKNKSEGKGKFDGKNKASHSTNFKKKTDKKKGACHVCGEPDHWAPNCPNRYDKRGNGGKTANVVIAGDTEMKDAGYGRKDLLRADGKRLTCFCS
ncbi:hypothetical protein QYE76_004022 [Lolium multiflorum]|uniref:CCHC-type domain-containing protein n=1 Tax=Lolium multiflorum TaxID=4521 RepID=A0AAD8RRS2_LOLMU|nr:hypothetical protein QYE76_004022 [Lolium multiflorum]